MKLKKNGYSKAFYGCKEDDGKAILKAGSVFHSSLLNNITINKKEKDSLAPSAWLCG